MIHLFCLSKGRSNDLLSFVIGKLKPGYHFEKTSGILGDVGGEAQEAVVSSLRHQGYHVFKRRLPEDLCDRLLRYAMSHECRMSPMDGQSPDSARTVLYPRGKPETVRYDFPTQGLASNQDVQHLLADVSFAAIAQDYLGARPVIDVLSLWWSTDFSDRPDMESAQYYHFDMDRPKWLKFFIYLTDVSQGNGPHTFVAGSHRTGGIPSEILQKGYARLTDEEVEGQYARKDLIEFVAPRGTIIAEDTRGLHKGRHVVSGDRLVLQIQFSNTLFGGQYPSTRMGNVICNELEIAKHRYPDLYSAYA